jgi:HTH-type transcriptional regulator/antitoxin HigA
MKIKPIRTKLDYVDTLKRVDQLMGARKGSAAGDELDILVTLLQAYEAKNFYIDFPHPVDAILHRMEALGLSRNDLQLYIGTRARVSEILSKKRNLTLNMIRRLNKYLGIPTAALIQSDAA